MSDLGSIATLGCRTKSSRVGNPYLQPTGLAWLGCRTEDAALGYPLTRLQSMMVGSSRQVLGGEDFTQGNPAAPCLRMDASGRWRFRWALPIGSHSIMVNVLHAINRNPRPSLVVKANPSIGIPADIESFAPPGTGWVTMSSGTFVVTQLGATWVELRNNLPTNVGASPCYFDHIIKT